MSSKQDLLEIVDAVASGINLTGDILEDGKVDWADFVRNLPKIMTLPTQITAAIAGAETITLDQLDSAEDRAEVVARFKSKVDIPSDKTEEDIEKGVETLLNAVAFIHSLVKKP